MDSRTVIVVLLTPAAVLFLVFAERKSRRNESLRRLPQVQEVTPFSPLERPLESNRRPGSRKVKSS
jgi:hypothetical protein